MSTGLSQAKEVMREVWRSRWLAVGVAWGASVLLGLGVLTVKDRYEASARIYIDTQSVLKPLMVGLAFQPDIEQQLRMLGRTLISRPNVEILRKSSEIGWDNKDAEDPKKREAEIESLMKAIKMTPGGSGTNTYAISYRDTDPQRAERLVGQLVKMFVNSGADNKRKDSQDARKFIDEEIREHEAKLVASENQLRDFKLKNFGVTGVSTQDYFARMSTLTEEVDKLRLEYSAAEQSRDALKRELGSEAQQLPPRPWVARPRPRPRPWCRSTKRVWTRHASNSTSCCAATPKSTPTWSAPGAPSRSSRRKSARTWTPSAARWPAKAPRAPPRWLRRPPTRCTRSCASRWPRPRPTWPRCGCAWAPSKPG